MLGQRSKQTKPLKNKKDRTIPTEPEQTARWAVCRAFPPPSVMPNTTNTEGSLLNVSIHPPSKEVIVRVQKQLKSGKAAGPDGIVPEELKINTKSKHHNQHNCYVHFSIRSGKKRRCQQNGIMCCLVKLSKKGDLGLCNWWHGIMLLSRSAGYSVALSLKG